MDREKQLEDLKKTQLVVLLGSCASGRLCSRRLRICTLLGQHTSSRELGSADSLLNKELVILMGSSSRSRQKTNGCISELN